jgi:CheY-like chemotaxis protein
MTSRTGRTAREAELGGETTNPSGSSVRASESSAARDAARCHSPPALLVVDDDEGDFMLLKRALYKVGATARVWWARDPGDALAILPELERSTCPVCVVIEVRLHAFDGWDLLHEIKGQPRSRPIKCVLLTGLDDDKTRRRAEAEGVDAFFVKPCDAEGLSQVARELQRVAAAA